MSMTMQKQAIAIAVAGAFVAPVPAMAQSTSAVQVYGNLYLEYSFASQDRANNGVDAADVDLLQTPGSSIGFKGEEKLGGGLSAWFQCESTADVRGITGGGFCSRNSAVGLKGGFGNLFVGVWDTPFKRTLSTGNVGGRTSGIFGTAFLLGVNSTTTTDGASPGVFVRRQRNLISYDSPRFGGFQALAAFSSTNSSTATTGSSAGAKPRVWSLGGTYKAGALDLGAAYERHTKAYPNVAQPGLATFAGDEEGYHLSAAYRIGPVKFGGIYTQQEADTAAAATAEVKVWHLGVEWKVAGPHNLHFGYTEADDVTGTAGGPAIGGGGATSRPSAGGDTGAKLYQIRYLYEFSKRTTGTIGYVNLKNDSSAAYDLGGLSYPNAASGAKQSAIALSVQHRF